MSQESQFSQDLQSTWVNWFCGLDGHQFFSEIDEDYLKDTSNLFGLKKRIQKYDEAISMLHKNIAPQEDQIQNPKFMEIYQHAADLFGLIHARYITTPMGLSIMRQKYLTGKFGTCPRVYCNKHNVLPIGISEDLKIARVKVYCPRCKDIFEPKKKSADVDGAYFGTSFPHLLLMTYPDMKPLFKKDYYQPLLFGFKIVDSCNIDEGFSNEKYKQNKLMKSSPTKIIKQEEQAQMQQQVQTTQIKKKNKNKKKR